MNANALHSPIVEIDYAPLTGHAAPVGGRYRTPCMAVHADGERSRVYVTHGKSGSRFWVSGAGRWVEIPAPVL